MALLVTMTLVSAPLAWLAYERNEVERREAAIAAITMFGGTVQLDEEKLFRPKWMQPLLGGKSAGEVVDVVLQGTQMTVAGVVLLVGLT